MQHTMKTHSIVLGILALSIVSMSCSSALYDSRAYGIDDLYGEHDTAGIAEEKRMQAEIRKAEAEARRAEAEARQAQWEALLAEAAYDDSSDSYRGVLADTYESAYARRLKGFSSPSYRMPSSYFNLRYGGAYHFVSAYDPASYNIVVMGDEVWVEPKYITSMFGTWGAANVFNIGFGFGFYDPWYPGWGYNSWWGWNNPWYWNGFYGYNPFWGYPWGYYPPYWGHYPGWGGPHHPSHPSPNRPGIVHQSAYRYGNRGNIGSTDFGGRNPGNASGNGYRNNRPINSGNFGNGANRNSGFRTGSSGGNRGSSTYRNPSTGSSSYRGSSNTSYTPATQQPNRGSYPSGGSVPRGGNTSGRNSYGR